METRDEDKAIWPGNAESLAEAIARLDEIIRFAIDEKKHSLGYFPVVYRQVTRQVTAAIEAHSTRYFEYPEVVERITIDFVNRYFRAFRKYVMKYQETGIAPADRIGECWEVAFRQIGSWRLTPLQHVLLGMNAHILYDLAPSVVKSAKQSTPEQELNDLIPDVFPRINAILISLVNSVQARINRTSTWLRMLDWLLGSVDERIGRHLLAGQRQQALANAILLDAHWGDETRFPLELQTQDNEAVVSASDIRSPNWFLSLLVCLSHWGQRKNFSRFAREVADMQVSPALKRCGYSIPSVRL